MEKDVPCAYCDASVVGASFVICSACAVPIHRDCWKDGGEKCPTYACGSTAATDPALALFRAPKGSSALDHVPAPPPPPAPAPAPATGMAGLLGTTIAGAEQIVKAVADVASGVISDVNPARDKTLANVSKGAPAVNDPPPALSALHVERAQLEAEVSQLRFWAWVRSCSIAGSAVILPWLLRDVSHNMLWVWLVFVIVVGSWPGRGGRNPKKRLRQLEARLDQLEQSK